MTPPLGPLEFKEGDFRLSGCPSKFVRECIAKEANRLLSEWLEKYLKNSKGEYSSMSEGKRLVMMLRSALEKKTRELKELKEMIEKAPEVFSFKGVRETVWHPHSVGGDTHRARLVCIEKLEGK